AVVSGRAYVPLGVMWMGQELLVLDNIVRLPRGSDLMWGFGVNHSGALVGTGTIGGVARSAFLLEPLWPLEG
ncbi:MAG TPA: hypothetical protein VGS21_02935, partial [Acidimicrobiales bacterium]|nr:hypothetical protein [Acidimicrobiales bacterium]